MISFTYILGFYSLLLKKMDWRDMIEGGKAALALLVFTIGVAVAIAVVVIFLKMRK